MVLATDIAETSLTVAGVRIVVDAGLAREPRFDPRTGMSRLTTVTTSRASADQRAGRAGRTEPGVAYRLWSKLDHGTRQAHRSPEIVQADLAGFALELAAWGGPEAVDQLDFIDRPPPGALAQAHELLVELGALEGPAADRPGTITALGERMLRIPVHPRLARMITLDQSALSCLLAALVDERDIVRGRDPVADIALRVAAVADRASIDGVDRRAAARVRDRAIDIGRRAGVGVDFVTVDPDRAGAVLLLAFPDRVAGRRRPGQFQLRTGSGAWLPDDDPLAHEDFVVAVDLDGKRDRARIRLAAAIGADDVTALLADAVVETRRIDWDTGRDELVETIDRRLGSLRLGEVTRRPAPGDATIARRSSTECGRRTSPRCAGTNRRWRCASGSPTSTARSATRGPTGATPPW